MTTGLSWFAASKLPVGTRVSFVEACDVYDDALIPAGSTGTVVENWLNEMQPSIHVLPDSAELRTRLALWDGHIIIGGHLDSGVSAVDDPKCCWHEPSPLAEDRATVLLRSLVGDVDAMYQGGDEFGSFEFEEDDARATIKWANLAILLKQAKALLAEGGA